MRTNPDGTENVPPEGVLGRIMEPVERYAKCSSCGRIDFLPLAKRGGRWRCHYCLKGPHTVVEVTQSQASAGYFNPVDTP